MPALARFGAIREVLDAIVGAEQRFLAHHEARRIVQLQATGLSAQAAIPIEAVL